MRWEIVNITPEHETYHLFEGEKKLLTLTLNPFSNSARVECNNEKRLFLVRKEGFRRNKTVIRNEYGIKIGEMGQEKNEQFFDVNDERFFFSTQDNPLPELVLYKESKEKPFVTCGLNVKPGSTGVHFSRDKRMTDVAHPGLLMALCWYLFLPVTRENSSIVPV